MNREGFDKLIFQLATMNTPSLLLGMESTASYHIALLSYLTALGYRVAIINPLVDRKLRKAVLEENEDGQEKCPYHRVSSCTFRKILS